MGIILLGSMTVILVLSHFLNESSKKGQKMVYANGFKSCRRHEVNLQLLHFSFTNDNKKWVVISEKRVYQLF